MTDRRSHDRRRVAIVGCRPPAKNRWEGSPTDWELYDRILLDVCEFVRLTEDALIVTGGAEGVDKAAETMASSRLHTMIYHPDYDKHGRRAPLERNTLIVQDADEVHAWPAPWSRGAWDTIRKARRAGKPCTVHEVSL